MKNRHLILTLLAAASVASAQAAITGQWRLHPTFDNSVTQVIDTPERVYFIGYPQAVKENIPAKSKPDCTLFYYDKEGDEIVAAAQRHALWSPVVRKIAYNPFEGYLMLIYDDQNIDILRDSGEVDNIPALMNASMPGSKMINSVTFDPTDNIAWLATDFGYVAVNDERLEVSESRNYGKPLKSVGRFGDDLWIVDSDGEAYHAPRKDSRTSLAAYTQSDDLHNVQGMYALDDSKAVIWAAGESKTYSVGSYDVQPGGFSPIWSMEAGRIYDVLPSKDGYVVNFGGSMMLLRRSNGSQESQARPEADQSTTTGATWDMKEFYNVIPRQGLRSYTLGSDKKFSLTKDFHMPNAPAPYFSRNMVYHPRYGMLVDSHGMDPVFSATTISESDLLSALKNNEWTPLALVYRNQAEKNVGGNPIGLAIDPDNDKYIYTGTNFSGMTRLNLDDPTDVIHFTHPGDATASLPSYVKLHDTSTAWARSSNFISPQFDPQKRLWAAYHNPDDKNYMWFYYWDAADCQATTSPATARPWKTLKVKANGLTHSTSCFLALNASVNKNMLLYMGPYGMVVVDHNGTPETTSDDKSMVLTSFTDQDGNTFSITTPNRMYEDTSTGVVWICSPDGLLYATPRNLLQGQPVLNRVKVARNDGTSLADYLLNGVSVNAMASDAEGRKWLATAGAGIVVVSSDAKKVYGEFTLENSDLPSNTVYDIAYNPGTHSMLISTDKGLAEFFIGGSADGNTDTDKVRAYPNPVAPDYYGWVTIDGVPDNALIKIVDAQGNLVRELGRAEGGSIQWDVNNLNYKRVRTGVYYILASSTSEGSGETRVGKVLVMN